MTDDFQCEFWTRDNLKSRRGFDHESVKLCMKPKVAFITDYLKLSKDSTVLDVGCGNGFYTYYFHERTKVTGVDYSEVLIKSVRGSFPLFVMDAHNLEFDNDVFDVVFAGGIMHHVGNAERVIDEMIRVSKKYVVVIEPNMRNPFMWLFALLVKEERRSLRMNREYFFELFERKGCERVFFGTHGLITPNKTPTLLAKLLSKFDGFTPIGLYTIHIYKKKVEV